MRTFTDTGRDVERLMDELGGMEGVFNPPYKRQSSKGPDVRIVKRVFDKDTVKAARRMLGRQREGRWDGICIPTPVKKFRDKEV